MIIDFHAHVFPDKIASKAIQAVSSFYDITMSHDGTLKGLFESGSRIGVDKYVILSSATSISQVESINNFVIDTVSTHPDKLIGFGTMHPGFPGFEDEFRRIMKAGIKGIKLHPDFQKFQIDTPEMDDVYEVLSDLGLPVLVHAGDIRFDYSGPVRISHVLDKHPRLKLVAAHFGGYTEWEDVAEYLAGRDLWFDTSSTLWKLPLEKAKALMNRHGTDRLLFGSDYPSWDHEEEFRMFETLGLSGSARDDVLYKNACRLLGL